MRKVAILGSTGSVGRQTLEVIAEAADELQVVALGCDRNVAKMIEQARAYGVDTLVYTAGKIAQDYRIYVGEDAMECYAAEGDYDLLVVAVVGIAGLRPTLAALKRGKTVCLANKETLVCGGELVMRAAATMGGALLPIDSEHSAIWQCMAGRRHAELKKIILTASGGALRDMPLSELATAKVEDVLRHPNWNMGPKITVDCATMVNKGFEVIEASYLFDKSVEDIDILIHRESVVHSMVQMVDNSYIAQMAVPDMRLPIQYALFGPRHSGAVVAPLDLTARALTFAPVEHERYPALDVVLAAAKRGGAACTAVNAADEVAVDAYLNRSIAYGDIHTILRRVSECYDGSVRDLEDVLRIDREARRLAKELI